MIIKVRVIPRSSLNEVLVCADGTLKVKLTASPVDGQANKLLVELLSDYFSGKSGKKTGVKIKKSDITIVRGETSRDKLIEIAGLSPMKFH